MGVGLFIKKSTALLFYASSFIEKEMPIFSLGLAWSLYFTDAYNIPVDILDFLFQVH